VITEGSQRTWPCGTESVRLFYLVPRRLGKLLSDAAAVSARLDRLLHQGHVPKCGRTKTDLPSHEDIKARSACAAANVVLHQSHGPALMFHESVFDFRGKRDFPDLGIHRTLEQGTGSGSGSLGLLVRREELKN